jgi:myo-inositol 2-dehydrogenase/D-chiro-inositol 1-dehydrogenase
MSDVVRIALIGTGRIGAMHAGLLAHQVEQAELVAVYDPAADLAQRVGDELGVAAAAHVEELWPADLDAVAICSPTEAHVDLIEAAAAAGKHIFCEKPIAQDLAGVDRALAAVEQAGVQLHVGFNRRFDPGHAAVRQAVVAGTIGEVHLVRITSRDPAPPAVAYLERSGGIFIDMTIHDFDMARFVTGSKVVEVLATGAVRVDPAIGELGDLDTAVVILRHADETITTIDNSRRAVYGYDQRVEAFGSDGVALSGHRLQNASEVRTSEGGRTPPLPWFFLDRYADSYVRQWEAVVQSMRDGSPPPVSGDVGRASIAIGLAARRSVDERRWVRVEEVG